MGLHVHIDVVSYGLCCAYTVPLFNIVCSGFHSLILYDASVLLALALLSFCHEDKKSRVLAFPMIARSPALHLCNLVDLHGSCSLYFLAMHYLLPAGILSHQARQRGEKKTNLFFDIAFWFDNI